MAENAKPEGPKDITPKPLDEAEKQKAAAAEAAAAAAAPPAPEAAPAEVEAGPGDIKGTLKESFVDSKTWNMIFQIILIVAGVFGIFMSIKGQEFIPLPAAAGALLLALAALFDIYMNKKFSKEQDKLTTIAKFSLAGVFGLLMVLFIVEMFKKFSLPVNKEFLALTLLIMAAVFSIEFIIYARKHKELLIADIQMFIATILSVVSIYGFYHYYVVPSFVMQLVSLILVITSITKDPLKDDERYKTRVLVIVINMLAFLAVFAYAAQLFFVKPISVIQYGKLTPSYKNKPVNLSWSGDSWSFAYNIFNRKKKEGTVNILNSLSMGINTLPPKADVEVADQDMKIRLTLDKEKMKKIEANLAAEKKREEQAAKEDDVKLPEFIDAPVFNKKGNFLVFTGGDTVDGPRNVWGVSLSLTMLETKEDPKEKEKLEAMTLDQQLEYKASKRAALDRLNMPVGKPKVVIADINKVIDRDCKPITHKTAWSPDGKSFCFDAVDKSGVYNVWSSDTREQTISRVTKGKRKLMPLWSPAGGRILYVSKTDSYTYLEVADYDGRHSRELNTGNPNDAALFPLWNAQESRVIYLKNGKLVIMNANATNQDFLSRKTLTPSKYWLTDSKKKVTLRYTESGNIWKIFTIKPNGTKNTKIFEEVCENLTQPKWSYDGKSIVVGADYFKDSSLWRLDKDGKFKTRLYTTKHPITELEWSPSSEKIAFIVRKKAIQSFWLDKTTDLEELWVINNDGTIPLPLYTATGEIKHMSWDDMGKRIAFDETFNRFYFQPTLTNVRIVHAIGSEKWDLLPYEFYGESPTWSNNGKSLAYLSWKDFWLPSGNTSRIWLAQLE